MAIRSTRSVENQDLHFNLHVDKDEWGAAQMHAALLCDIRRELNNLKAEISQQTVAYSTMLKVLKGIRKNTYKRRRKKRSP